MARYIDADKLMEECKNHTVDEVYPEWNDKKVFDALCQMGHMFKKIIDETPTADVVEVKHGEWIVLEAEIGLYSCSLCEHKILRAECNYCPNCGAKMEGGKADDL